MKLKAKFRKNEQATQVKHERSSFDDVPENDNVMEHGTLEMCHCSIKPNFLPKHSNSEKWHSVHLYIRHMFNVLHEGENTVVPCTSSVDY